MDQLSRRRFLALGASASACMADIAGAGTAADEVRAADIHQQLLDLAARKKRLNARGSPR